MRTEKGKKQIYLYLESLDRLSLLLRFQAMILVSQENVAVQPKTANLAGFGVLHFC